VAAAGVEAAGAVTAPRGGDSWLPARPAGGSDHAAAEQDVFLCHAEADSRKAAQLYDRLVEAGIRPWMAGRDIDPGRTRQLEIGRALRRSRIVVVVLSAAAVRHAGYVQGEIREALKLAQQRPPDAVLVIPVLLGDCEVPDRLREFQWIDLTRPGGRQRLIAAVLRDAGRAAGEPGPSWATRVAGAVRRPALWIPTLAALAGWAAIAAWW
jgi:hypothetical protein